MSTSDTLRAVRAPIDAVDQAQEQIRKAVIDVLVAADLGIPEEIVDSVSRKISESVRKVLLSLTWTAYQSGVKRGHSSP